VKDEVDEDPAPKADKKDRPEDPFVDSVSDH